MSISWQTDVSPAPAILVLPPAAVSLDEAHAAIELWERYKKRKLDPTQRLVVEVLMATDAVGTWAAATTGREMPRQNGKGDEIEVVELWGLVQRSERILHTIHDAVLLATETQSRLLSVLEGHPDLRRLKKREWRGTGQQMIEMRNGGIIWYRTRTGGGARGVDEVDRVVIDEAQHAEPEHLAAVTPTLLASANPQLNAMGSAGIDGKSVWWWQQRKRALRPGSGSFGYVGHTAETISLDADGRVVSPEVNVLDRRLWAVANPVLTRRPDLYGYLEEQLERLPTLFGREHLGVWDPLPEDTEDRSAKLPVDRWVACSTVDDFDGPCTLAYEVSLDGEWSSVALAAGSQESPYVQQLEHKQGTGWLPGDLVRMVQSLNPTRLGCIGGDGPAGQKVSAVQMALSEAGLALPVEQLSMTAYRRACGAFYMDVVEGRLRWFAGSGPLDLAARDAAARQYGDAWSWDLRDVTVPISPLGAATVARALLPVEVEKPKPRARLHSF